MPYSLEDKLVIAITSRALFDLAEANRVFDGEGGLSEYRKFELEREDEPLKCGTGYSLVKALLGINERLKETLIEVILVSRNDADSGLRILNSIESHRLSISRIMFTDGRPCYPYLPKFHVRLFLSAYPDDVAAALRLGVPAALVYPPPQQSIEPVEEVRIAFDGDAVLFSDESETINEREGLESFQRHEQECEDIPLPPGPFKPFLEALSTIQARFNEQQCPLRTALVTARNAPAHKRVIKTLRAWGIRLDESFFLGGIPKDSVLSVFKPHIFFDDQAAHLKKPAGFIPVAQVLRKTGV